MSAQVPLTPPDRPWWKDVPTLAAVVGLFIALVFNTVGVWLQVGESQQAGEDTALALLTQLNGLARQAEGDISGARVAFCKGRPLKAQDEAALMKAAQYYDYLAWLFNSDHIRMASARRYWAPSMIETYELAAVQRLTTAQKRFLDLRRFKFETPKEQWPNARAYC